MPRQTRRTTQARAPRWALVTRHDLQAGPCYALESTQGPPTVIYVGPAQGPAAHVYRRIALQLAAQDLDLEPVPTANATARTCVQSRATARTLHGAAHIRSSRHRR